jgi:hypothetical protein
MSSISSASSSFHLSSALRARKRARPSPTPSLASTGPVDWGSPSRDGGGDLSPPPSPPATVLVARGRSRTSSSRNSTTEKRRRPSAPPSRGTARSTPRQRLGRNAARWCFTRHPPLPLVQDPLGEDPFIHALRDTVQAKGWKCVVQLEKGAQGRPHFQGYIERPRGYMFEHPALGKAAFPDVHWEVAKGTTQQNVAYCTKDEGRLAGPFTSGLKVPRATNVLTDAQVRSRPWQRDLAAILEGPADDRTIYWIYERAGNTGKSAFVKWWCFHHPDDAMLVSGKSADAKHGVVSFREEHGQLPGVVFIDCPRDSLQFFQYPAMEEIKNACFFSGKFESKMVMGATPHMVVFANEKPDFSKLSRDRWSLKRITEDHEMVQCQIPLA